MYSDNFSIFFEVFYQVDTVDRYPKSRNIRSKAERSDLRKSVVSILNQILFFFAIVYLVEARDLLFKNFVTTLSRVLQVVVDGNQKPDKTTDRINYPCYV